MNRANRKVAVIGSNSFSGSYLIDLLLEDANISVVGISRSPEYPDCLLAYKRHRDPDFVFHQLDLNTDHDRVMAVLDSFRPEYIVNFAAQGEVRSSFDYPEHYYMTNTLAVVRLVNALKDRSYLTRYVHISTPEVYGGVDNGAKEDAAFNPSSPYAASKGSADLFINALVKTLGFPAVTIRATNVYGPHQQLFRIIPRTIIYIKMGRKIRLHGGGRAIKSYAHIRDISEGELAAMVKGRNGRVYHLSPDGKGMSIREVVETVCGLMGERFENHVEIDEERLGQDAVYVVDSTRARTELGWRPKIDFHTGVQQMIDWIEKDWDTIKTLPLEYQHKP